MTLIAIAVRALFAFLFLLVILRVSGKRAIGQATALDFIVALILGDLIDDLLWADVSAAQFVVATSMVMLCHISLALVCLRSPAVGALVHGVPVEVLRTGALRREGMRRERVNDLEVAALLRQNNVSDQREVKSGTLEVTGQLSVSQQEWAREAQKQDLPRVREAAR